MSEAWTDEDRETLRRLLEEADALDDPSVFGFVWARDLTKAERLLFGRYMDELFGVARVGDVEQ